MKNVNLHQSLSNEGERGWGYIELRKMGLYSEK